MLTMATPTPGTSLRQALLCREGALLTDGELLEAFLGRRDAAAFEALMRRHGPMVLGVCRRVLRNEADAEDAFQATFLVLLRKAASVRPRALVGNWLYGVAHTTALKARAMNSKRLAKERTAAARSAPEQPAENGEQLHQVLDQELKALPAIYRAAIVLCDLEGKTIKEAALQLGCPPGTVGTRLSRGRSLLARRLARHGLGVSSAVLGAVLAQHAPAASVPPPLMNAMIQAAQVFAGDPAAVTTVLSTRVLTLTRGVMTSMLLTKLEIVTACCLAACVVAAGAGIASYGASTANEAEPPPPAPREPRLPAGPRPGENPMANNPEARNIHGSGKVATKEWPLADFAGVEVSRSFQVEIVRADTFRVAVTTDDNLLPYIQANKKGTTLGLAVDPTISFWVTSLKATIGMPALDEVRMVAGGNVRVKGFKSDKPFQAFLGRASVLEGELDAKTVNLELAGGGQVALKGRARELKARAARAGRLSLADLVVDKAEITLQDASTASLNAKDELVYNLSGASRLEYLGNPPSKKGTTSDASSVVPVTAEELKNRPPAPAGPPHRHGAGPVAIGARVPDFALRDLDGRVVNLRELQKDTKQTKNGVIVLCFWCSTCSSCRRVEHTLDKLARDYQGQALVLALDANAGETGQRVRAFAKENGLKLPIFLNPDGALADLFGIEVTTTTVILDGDGKLRYCGRFRDGDRRPYVEEALQAVLSGKEVAVPTTPHDG